MARKKKTISMVVEVSVPAWLTAAQARKEVRSLIQHQAFHGHMGRNHVDDLWDEIGDDNFKLRAVRSVGAHVRRA